MDIDKQAETFFLDESNCEIWSRTTWCRTYVKDLTPEETEALYSDPGTTVFVNRERNRLDRVPDEKRGPFWTSEVDGHVAADASDIDLSEFERGYCFVAQMWKARFGKSVLVLKYLH